MKLALTAGGTGGHLIPAFAVLDATRKIAPEPFDVRFFGPDDRGERGAVEARGVRFEAVPSAAVRGRGPLALVRSLTHLSRGVIVAWRRLHAFDPDVVFSTGGYGSFPCSVAARLLRRPLVVYLPDVSPGWAVRAETHLATRMATSTPAALAFLPREKTTVTGYPVRETFGETTRAQARRALGLGDNARVVLIAGASQGAQSLNTAVFGSLERLTGTSVVFHITGTAGYAEAAGLKEGLAGKLAANYHPAPYREDLPLVMLAADLAVMRAGASVLGELPAAALPAILVPGRYAGGHQRDNARWLEENGAAVILEESGLGSLDGMVLELLGDRQRLTAMRAAVARLAQPEAARAIARLVVEVARR